MTAQISKASILAVGTEITTGQITNRNATWLSEQLTNLGVEVVLHEAVADDRPQILQALNHCASVSGLVFVTGGLGPTTDDFTREVISEWLGKPLEFDESLWNKIVARLTQLGIHPAESNRQQCYFPKGAQVLQNPAGTAAGFTQAVPHHPHQRIWVFPGPPTEVRAVWEQGVEKMIREVVPELHPTQLLTWQCIGKSEAELGEITEKVLWGSGLKTGYRAHRPVVEIKVWCTEKEKEEKASWLKKLDESLSPWLLTRQGEDLAAKLLYLLQRSEDVAIMDCASGGVLADRLGTLLRKPAYTHQAEDITFTLEWAMSNTPEEWVSCALEQADDEATTLIVAGFTADGRGALGLREGSRVFQESVQAPYHSAEWPDRVRYFLTEIALKRWCEWLDSATT